MLDLSIIVVSWNAKGFLRQCVESIRGNIDLKRAEIIVVDNASSDGSWEMVQECFPEVRLIRNSANLGFAKGSNIGIRSSGGRYVCLVNSDVEILDNCFDRLAACLDANPMIGMIGPRIVGSDGKTQRSSMGFPSCSNVLWAALALPSIFPRLSVFDGWMLSRRTFDGLETVDILNGMFLMLRRKALDEVGLLDEAFFMYGEDMDWCRRFWKSGWQVALCPDAQAVHYGGGSSANSPVRFYVELNRALVQYFAKHHRWFGRQAIRGIIALHHIIRVAGNAVLYVLRPTGRSQASWKIKRSMACLAWLTGLSIPVNDRPGFRG